MVCRMETEAELLPLPWNSTIRFPSVLESVRCIADSDFDFVLSSRKTSAHLLYTDYTSVELYTYDKDFLSKVLLLGFNIPESDTQSLFDSMTLVLQELFIVRASNQSLNWGMRLVVVSVVLMGRETSA